MYQGATIGVVVPAYNEERHIGRVIDTLPDYVDCAYVIDDGSTDDTWAVIQEYARRRNGGDERSGGSEITLSDGSGSVDSSYENLVVPLRHGANRGVGGAIKTGYLRALDDGVDVTVVVGGDGQMLPEQILRLVEPVIDGEADYAKGNRLLDRESRRGMPGVRFVGNTILSVLTKVASGYWKTMDPQNGFTAISRDALAAIDVERMYEDYGYCNDLLVRLNVAGLRVADVAIPAVYGDEKSHIRYSRYIPRVSLLLLGDFLWRLRTRYFLHDFNPLVSFYAIGAFLTVAGVLAGLWSMAQWLGADGTLLEPMLLSVLVWGVGVLALTFAMVLDMQANEGRELQIR